jgi:hypothetical protein
MRLALLSQVAIGGALASTCLSAQSIPPKRVLYLNARTENQPCIAQDGVCMPPGSRFIEWAGGPELVVVNRRFLTSYTVRVDGSITPLSPGIRGLEEVANIKLSPPAFLPAPKGGVAALNPHTTDEFFAELVDETQAEKPFAIIDSDLAELQRQAAALVAVHQALEEQLNRLVTGAPGSQTSQDVVSLRIVADSLKKALGAERGAPRNNNGQYFDEDGFRLFNRTAKDLVDQVSALATALNQANFPSTYASAVADQTQFEQNVLTFAGNARALKRALDLDSELVQSSAYAMLRRDQLRAQLRKSLKAAPTDQNLVIDEAELNTLVEHYASALVGRPSTRAFVETLRHRLGGDYVGGQHRRHRSPQRGVVGNDDGCSIYAPGGRRR